MSYTSVKKILEDRDEAECERYHDLIPMFELMKELSHILRERRHRRGAIDFDFSEAKIILNESGEPVDIKAYDRNVATKIIEDFSLLQMRRLQRIISGRRFHSYTVCMKHRMRIR